MARSNQNRKVIPSEDFSDTLDKMLNKAVPLADVTELSQDDDIMDQLIMEDVFDVADEEIERLSSNVNNRKIEKDKKNNIENIISEIRKGQVDEFSAPETTKIQKVRAKSNKGELNVDDLLDLVDEKYNFNQKEDTKNNTNPELENMMVEKHKSENESIENVDEDIESLSKGVNDLELAIKNKKAMESKTSDVLKEEVDAISDSDQSIKEDELDIDDLLDSVDEESNIKQEEPAEIDEFSEESETLNRESEDERVENNAEENESDEKTNQQIASLSSDVKNLGMENENKEDLKDQTLEIQKNEVDELNIKKDEKNIDDLLDSIDDESKVQDEKSTESDLSSEPEMESDVEKFVANNESVKNVNEQNSDSIIADFDISSDDEILESDNELIEKVQAANEGEEEINLLLNQSSEEIKKSNIAIDGLNNKVNQLIEDNDSLRNQISVLVAAENDGSDMLNSLESLKKQQKSLTRQFKEKGQLSPMLTYAALGLAGFSVLLAGGLGTVGYGAKSDVTELSELVATLDEETDDLIASSSKADIEKLNEKTRLLILKNEKLTEKIDEVKNSILTNSLEPIVDDLVENNEQTQQTIGKLQAKVKQLEKRKPVTVKAKSKSRKVNKVVEKSTWVVNLVSFKQEWYAKSKAEEFEKKGVPTDVIKVKVKGENWFRLRVKDFKSKYDAASYAVKVKKTLNLGSVWVTKF
ncbi:MAG: SPOR domain-containing protein [Methylococcaceae bacterium]|nr:SPOR domain-containing protein [Methylococcaceae bacterium]